MTAAPTGPQVLADPHFFHFLDRIETRVSWRQENQRNALRQCLLIQRQMHIANFRRVQGARRLKRGRA